MLGGTGTPEFQRFGYDYPFEKTRGLLKQAQLVFGNLEGPMTHADHAPVEKKYVYRSPPEKVAPALRNAGFNVVSLANNHTMDQGVEGLRHTLEALDLVGIKYAGAGMDLAAARRPAILQAGNTRVAFLAYTLTFPEEFWATPDKPGSPFGHEAHVRADIAAATRQADIVIVSFHWGAEGKIELRDYQKQLGRAAIDAGAAAVIGHHPHVLQGVERYRHGVILYSLGNFAFGTYGPEAFRSAIAFLTFRARYKKLAESAAAPAQRAQRRGRVPGEPARWRGGGQGGGRVAGAVEAARHAPREPQRRGGADVRNRVTYCPTLGKISHRAHRGHGENPVFLPLCSL